ncbi:MAG: hypothetical protein R3A52_01135 [Polyangiales bacterium]
MTRRASALAALVALTALVSEGAAQERPDGPAPSTSDDAMTAAIVARVAACVSAEGGALTPAQRESAARALGPVAGAVVTAAGEGRCEGDVARRRCARALSEMACADLAAATLTLPAWHWPGATTAWAEGYARLVDHRVTACLTAERAGAAPDARQRYALDLYARRAAVELSVASRRAGCAANENLLPACGRAVEALSCGDLRARLHPDPRETRAELGDDCARLVTCEAAPAPTR